jgi:hypothetical protein
MFAAVLVIAMTPSFGLKRGLLIYEETILTRVQDDHSHLKASYLQSREDLHRPLRNEERRSRRIVKVNPIGSRLCNASWLNFSFPGVTDRPIVFGKWHRTA